MVRASDISATVSVASAIVTTPKVSEQSGARAARSGAHTNSRSWFRGVSRQTVLLRLVLVVGSGFALLLLGAVVERVAYAGEVLPGVDVEGIDAESRSEADVSASLESLAKDLETKPLKARASGTDLEADPSAVQLKVDVEKAVATARTAGRSRNPLEAVAGFVLRRFRDEKVSIPISYDDAGVEGLLDGWQALVLDGVQEGDLQFEGTEVIVVEPRAGVGILRDQAREQLVEMLGSISRKRLRLEVGDFQPEVNLDAVEALASRARRIVSHEYVVTGGPPTNPDGITLMPLFTLIIRPEDVAGAIDAVVQDGEIRLNLDPELLRAALGDGADVFAIAATPADFSVGSGNTVRIVRSVNGRELDLNAVAALILDEQTEIDAPFETVVPEHDTAWARSLGITEVVSSFTTHHPCCAARVTNIHTAASIMDNTVVAPGEEFSLNDVVGARTAERGFVLAPVIYGDFTEDYGGGVSQLATTTFNAVFWGGFELLEHKPHSVYFSRYPMGREATVNYPGLDMRWRNNSEHGVLVKTSFTDDSLTVTLFGDSEGRVVREESEDGTCSEGPSTDTYTEQRCVKILSEIPIVRQDIKCSKAKTADDPDGECASLKPGETEQTADGHEGYIVELWRVVSRKGQEDEREKFRWQYQMYPDKWVFKVDKPPTTSTSVPPSTGSTTTTSSSIP